MSSLKDAVKKVSSSTSSGSTKTPSFYNQQKRDFVHDMVTHIDPEIRAAALSSSNCPSNNVNHALLNDSDVSVIRAILLSKRANLKTLNSFVETSMCNNFNDDEEVTKVVLGMLSGDAEEEVVAEEVVTELEEDEA